MCQQPADRRVFSIFHDKRIAYFVFAILKLCYSHILSTSVVVLISDPQTMEELLQVKSETN